MACYRQAKALLLLDDLEFGESAIIYTYMLAICEAGCFGIGAVSDQVRRSEEAKCSGKAKNCSWQRWQLAQAVSKLLDKRRPLQTGFEIGR